MNTTTLSYINLEDIFPHPNNPRRELGDLTELAESIRANGILQNLTVMEGHYSEEDGTWHKDKYTLLIGHRRCSAAKIAELKTVPCMIVKNDNLSDQVGTMLCENIHRADLSATEQANGFQLMLDLGSDTDTIAKKTGFSKKTVQKRLNIAKLDQEVLKEKEKDESFQMNLTDLYLLDKLESIDTQNEILKNATSSREIKWRVDNAYNIEKRTKLFNKVLPRLSEMDIVEMPAEETKNIWKNYTAIATLRFDENDEDDHTEEILNKVKDNALYYTKGYECRNITFYKAIEITEEEETEESLAEKKRKSNKEIITKSLENFTKKIRKFTLDIVSGKIEPLKDITFDNIFNEVIDSGYCISANSIKEFYIGKNQYQFNDNDKEKAATWYNGLSAINKLIVMYAKCLFINGVCYWDGTFNKENSMKLLEKLKLFEKYGFALTEEEATLFNGTHENYNQPKTDEDDTDEDDFYDSDEDEVNDIKSEELSKEIA